MRKILPLFLIVIMLMPIANAVAPVDMSATRGMTGGYMLDISTNSTETTAGGSLTDAPNTVEIYTATWCMNCVDSEHAVMDAIGNDDVTILTYHRFIDESQDPFGTEAGDNRWIELYGEVSKEVTSSYERAPPTIIFNGTQLRIGSVPEGDSLQSDYEALLAKPSLDYSAHGATHSEFSWTGNNSSGVLDWEISVDTNFNASNWTHRLMVVENSAHFPDGSNGLEYYEDVVRAVFTLDGQLNSNNTTVGDSVTLDLPAAWDGDDLSLVLVHEIEFSSNSEQSDGNGKEEADEDEKEDITLVTVAWIIGAIVLCGLLPFGLLVAFSTYISRNEDKHVVNPYFESVQ